MKKNIKTKDKKTVQKKKIQYSKKESGGFTLIELLAVIAVLSLVISIGMYSVTSLIGKAKEKTYLTTVNEIEKAAGSYATEFKSFFAPVDEDREHKCVTVKELIDTGFLDKSVTQAVNTSESKVALTDYIYISRNRKTKTVLQQKYTKNESASMICQSISSSGSVLISVNPSIHVWSKEKDVTVTYVWTNNDGKIYELTGNYLVNDDDKLNYKSFINTTRTVTNNFSVTEKGLVMAAILEKDKTPPVITAEQLISKIDNDSPTISTGTVKILVRDVWKEQADTNIVVRLADGHERLSIPFLVTDCQNPGTDCSGVKKDIDGLKSKLIVKVGDNEVTDYGIEKPSKCDSDYCEGTYEITMHVRTIASRGWSGKVDIKFKDEAFSDNVGNKSREFSGLPNIIFDNTVDLTFDANGGTYNGDSSLKVEYAKDDNKYLDSVPSMTGKVFAGWYTDDEEGEKVYDSTGKFISRVYDSANSKWVDSRYWETSGKWKYYDSSELKLYAHWTANTFKLTLDPNQGSYDNKTTTSTKTMKYGTKDNNNVGPATRTGYTFDGWYTAANGGVQVYDANGRNVNASTYWTAAYSSGTWKYNGNLTLYAHWATNAFQLTLNPNHGKYANSTSTSTKTMIYGTSNNNDVGPATRTGYTFDGWYTAANGGVQVYDANGRNVNASTYWTAAYSSGIWKYSGNLTVYAHWTPHKIKIRYITNGGKLDVDSNIYHTDAYGNIYRCPNEASSCNDSDRIFDLQVLDYGSEFSSTGLLDYNNRGYVNVVRNDYKVEEGKEWKCIDSDGHCVNEYYNQDNDINYKANDICDASERDCLVKMAVNWVPDYKVKIRYNTNGGSFSSLSRLYANAAGNIYKCSENDSECGTNSDTNGNYDIHILDANGRLSTDGLYNWSSSKYMNITRSGYKAKPGEEWLCTGSKCKRSTYDQDSAYYASQICDTSEGSCSVTMKVNWISTAKPTINFRLFKREDGVDREQSGVYYTFDGSNPTWINFTPVLRFEVEKGGSNIKSVTFKYDNENGTSFGALSHSESLTVRSDGIYVRQIDRPGYRHFQLVVEDVAGNKVTKDVYIRYEKEVTMTFDVDATNAITNKSDGSGVRVFNPNYKGTGFRDVQILKDVQGSYARCRNNGSACAGVANDGKYFGVSCMNVGDYYRIFRVTGLSVNGGSKTIKYGFGTRVFNGAGGRLHIVKTHKSCDELAGYSTYDITRTSNPNFSSSNSCTGNQSLTGYSFQYESPAGNRSNTVNLYVQYSADCGY